MKELVVVHCQGLRSVDLDGVTIRLDYQSPQAIVQVVLMDGTVAHVESNRAYGLVIDALVDLAYAVRELRRIASTGQGGIVLDPARVQSAPAEIDQDQQKGG